MSDNPSFTFVWSIENFSLFYPWIVGDSIYSNNVWYGSDEIFFYLGVSPAGNTDSPNRVHLEIQFENPPFTETQPVECELSFLSTDDSLLVTERKLLKTEQFSSWNLENCPTQEEVFVTKRSIFLPEDVLKVRCRIWTPVETITEPMVAHEIGRVYPEKSKNLFSLPNISMLRMGEKQALLWNSPFSLRVEEFALTFELSGDEQVVEDADIDIEVTLTDCDLYNSCQISVLNRLGQTVISELKTGALSNEKSVYKFEKFIKRKKLLQEMEFLSGQVLSLMCELILPKYVSLQSYIYGTPMTNMQNSLSNESKHPFPVPSQISSTEPPHLISLQEDLLSLYEAHKLSDFQLRTEATSFPVHKAILAARSPVFEALFSSDMKEVVCGFQDVPDIDKETIERMLLFVYTNIVRDLQWEEAAKLYYAADKYQILPLREKCSSYLQANMDASNVCAILEIADKHNDSELRSIVEEFLLDHTEEIMSSKEWRVFSEKNLQLANQTMCKMFSKLTGYRKKHLPS